MPFPERSIVVIGPGLLGGSLLKDARELGCLHLAAYARRVDAIEEIRSLALADVATTDLQAAVALASLIILATPVGSYPAIARQLTQCQLQPDVLVTDVGSVKGVVMAETADIFGRASIPFIGSHPMAGKEQAGLAASQTGLYKNALTILTPPEAWSIVSTPLDVALGRLREFWAAVGSRVCQMTVSEHDHTVARISHLPHLAAVAVVLAAQKQDPAIAHFGAGGLRDTTRVASGSPAMWKEILMENRKEVVLAATDLRRVLDELIQTLTAGDTAHLESLLEEAKKLRDLRYG